MRDSNSDSVAHDAGTIPTESESITIPQSRSVIASNSIRPIIPSNAKKIPSVAMGVAHLRIRFRISIPPIRPNI
jgi:hypothetical protein